MTSTNVVLVVVQYEQWECQTAAGDNLQFILSVFIAAAAGDRHLAYRIYENREKMGVFKQAPNKGKIYGRKVFLWFEKKLTENEKKQVQDLKHGRNQHWGTVR